MSVKERIEALQSSVQKQEVQPVWKLKEVLTKSGIERIVEELKSGFDIKVTREVQEEGGRLYIEVVWPPGGNTYNRIVIGVRGESIKFIGGQNPEGGQFIELRDGDMFNRDLLEESL